MKGLKRLFLVCVLMICVVFSLTACDKSSNTNDIKVDNEAHAEESAPPIEYWLERGSSTGLTKVKDGDLGFYFQDGVSEKLSSVFLNVFPSSVDKSARHKKLRNLQLYYNFSVKKNYKKIYLTVFTMQSIHWVDVSLDAVVYKYKNGVCTQSRHYLKSLSATKKKRHPRIDEKFEYTGDGLYVVHIRKATTTMYFGVNGQFPSKHVFAKDEVVAFQIGSDDFCDNFKG